MAKEYSEKELNKALFTQLIMMLSSSAMQQLGKLVNPATHKTETDLEGAQITIDMLDMLQQKTKGNLDRDEDNMLTSILSSLQMNYVETLNAKPAQENPGQKPVEPETKPGNTTKESKETQADTSRPAADSKDPKYHKSYGEA